MYAKEAIKSNNRKFAYCNKGDEITVVDSKKHPLLLVRKGNDEPFITHADNLQVDPLFLEEVKSPDILAKKELKSELAKLLRKDSYQFKIIFNRVYADKVVKFPKHITKQVWLEVATQLWEVSPVGSMDLIDPVKANQ